MRNTFTFILCGLCQVGCVSHSHTSQQVNDLPSKPTFTIRPVSPNSAFPAALAPWEWDDLERAVSEMDMFGDGLPERWLRRLQPVEVYRDRGGVVIALYRDAHYEWGYYVMSLGSSASGPLSSDGSATYDRGWTFTPLENLTIGGFLFQSSLDRIPDSSPDILSSLIYAYSRHR